MKYFYWLNINLLYIYILFIPLFVEKPIWLISILLLIIYNILFVKYYNKFNSKCNIIKLRYNNDIILFRLFFFSLS